MAKYIERNLGPGERVILAGKVHWACLIPSIILSLVIIGIPSLIKNIIRMATTELGFTNKNFIGKTGLINTKVMNSPLNKVQTVSVNQGLFGKIFGYGTVYVDSSSRSYVYANIARADNFRTSLLNAIEEYEQEKIKKSAQEMASALKGATSE